MATTSTINPSGLSDAALAALNASLNGTFNASELPPPGLGINYASETEEFRLPQGIWVWLTLIIPCCIGLAIVYVWYRLRLEGEEVDEPAAKLEQEVDKMGTFNLVKATPPWVVKQKKKPWVFIDVGE